MGVQKWAVEEYETIELSEVHFEVSEDHIEPGKIS